MKKIETQDLFLLQEAYECGNLDVGVLEIITNMKKEKVLSIHPYSITTPKNIKGRWQTFIKTEHGDRQKISSTTEKGLIDKLYHHYFEECAATLETFYPMWLEKRKEEGLSARTVQRNENHWNKYYKGHEIATKPMHKITVEQIEKFFHEAIKQHGMTVKELGNMKFIFVDMMKLAKKRNIIKDNPFLEVEVKTTACKPQRKHNDTSRVYLHEEKEKLFQALNKEILNRPHITDMYAVFLLFKLGLRIGELVAIKWEDIDLINNEIHIHRMETLDDIGNNALRTTVVEYTKKKSPYGDRFLPLSTYEIDIFKKVQEINESYGYKAGDFVFCDEKGRTTIRAIDNLIRKACNMASIETKSAHDIRRTVASEMFNQGVPVEIIRNYLGHSDIKTTYGYILDNNGKEKTNKMILRALGTMNGLKGTQVS